jgi:hypothetical protein
VPRVVKRQGKTVGRDSETTVSVETPADRSQYRRPDITSAESKAFFARLDKTGMLRLRKEPDARAIGTDEDRELAVDGGKYHPRANPRKSHGYI